MRVIYDIEKNAGVIERCISKHGFLPEHNYHHFACLKSPNKKRVFFMFEKDTGVMVSISKNHVWKVIAEPLAPKELRCMILHKIFEYALKRGSKVVVEVSEEMKNELIASISYSKKFKSRPINYILYWPVYNLQEFDERLEGKNWKKIRNIINKFRKSGACIVPAKCLTKESLHNLVEIWARTRKIRDRINLRYYHNIINSNFNGFDDAHSVVIRDTPVALTGGWKIPNSKDYYSCLGISDHRINGVSEFANISELLLAKKKGYSKVDFGGSDQQLLNFKKKFRPKEIYKTYVFSIVKK
ncbi:MAG: phosphatidylglycerol lysyltransferase domain-containing protein [Candidatus Woesearchaeota archaeon]